MFPVPELKRPTFPLPELKNPMLPVPELNRPMFPLPRPKMLASGGMVAPPPLWAPPPSPNDPLLLPLLPLPALE